MWKKTYNFALLFLIFPMISFAQNPRKAARQEKIEAAKVAIITNRLNLSTEQAQQFWAVYNDFDDRRQEIRKNIRLNLEGLSLVANDDKIVQAIKDIQNLRQKEIDLEKEYLPKFLKVINVRQYAELLRTERNFNQLLLNQLSNAKD